MSPKQIRIVDVPNHNDIKRAVPRDLRQVQGGDEIQWVNETAAFGFDVTIVFAHPSPFEGDVLRIQVPRGGSSAPQKVKPHPPHSSVTYRYKMHDPAGHPIQDPHDGPGDPGILVGD